MNFYETIGYFFCILCGILGFLILIWLLLLGIGQIRQLNEETYANSEEDQAYNVKETE